MALLALLALLALAAVAISVGIKLPPATHGQKVQAAETKSGSQDGAAQTTVDRTVAPASADKGALQYDECGCNLRHSK